jgi:branched-chain amino acid transport system ATP-binding protein
MDGAVSALRENADVREIYLAMSAGDRRSFRNVKSYKRRKRCWLDANSSRVMPTPGD